MPSDILEEWKDPDRTTLDFIVVGGGAAGAPLAARLVERGFSVLVVEMGPERTEAAADGPLPFVENTRVPLLHPEATENARHSLRYFVKHFDHDPEGSLDPKIHHPGALGDPKPHPEDEHGVFYPRAQGIGGCTIHNAMITVAGPAEDWDEIAEATQDDSWRGERMRVYFERLENCHYDNPSLWARIKRLFGFRTGWENSRHGHRGWLDTTVADPGLLLNDLRFLQVVLDAVLSSFASNIERVGTLVRATVKGRALPRLDPNHWETMRHSPEGLCLIPTAITPKGERSGPRDRLLGLAAGDSPHRKRIHILSGACVTKVLLKDNPQRTSVGGIDAKYAAAGISCLRKANAYEADANARAVDRNWRNQLIDLYCRREVILCGGAFNTPQLLMLSGIGPAEHLHDHGIEPRVALPGVGSNLQDRYEVPVIATITDRFRSLDGVALTSRGPDAPTDPQLVLWRNTARLPARERGLYASNGGLISIFKRSQQEEVIPDLYMFALAGNFPGYSVGWSRPQSLAPGKPLSTNPDAAADHNRSLTWLILKARTRHNTGEVRLRSSHPFRRPEINFRSFPQAPDDDDLEGKDPDLEALYEATKFVEGILERGRSSGTIESFSLQGIEEFDGDVRRWIKHIAWGHHACGTCRIGAEDDPGAVLDSRFRVRGVERLRVVDASVFPRIPGYFIVTNVYMIAEKAADVLTEDQFRSEDLAPEVVKALNYDPVFPSRPEFEDRVLYPISMEQREAEIILRRRAVAGLENEGEAGDARQPEEITL